jgi:hypothetical protein
MPDSGEEWSAPADVGLVLTSNSQRRLDAKPREVSVGALRMQGWQIHPVRPCPDGFAGQDPYLIKVNYDLLLEPGIAVPLWFEVGLTLSCPVSDGTVAVLDAVPHTVLERQEPTAYVVTEYLNLVQSADHGGGTRGILLPALSPFIDAFGIGDNEIRWRHTSGVRPGSHSALMVLVTPEGSGELAVRVSARFDLGPDDSLGLLSSSLPASFRLNLTEAPSGAPVIETGASAPVSQHAPRVFVSYTHDDEEHKEKVRALSEFLARDCGLDVHLDQWDTEVRRDWYEWAIDQIIKADFVLVIASPMCRLVGDGQVPGDRYRGMQSEISLIREGLHGDRPTWRTKLLPVVLPDRSVDDIPLFLQPHCADRYSVTDLTVAGAEDLLRTITGQPAFLRPIRNPQVVSLPPRSSAYESGA